MTSHFTSDFFSNNRARLRASLDSPLPVVLTAHGLVQRNSDTTFLFRQDSSFWYLTGIDEPDIILVMDKDKEYLIVPKRETTREAFDGTIDVEYLSKRAGIREILSQSEGWKHLSSRLKQSQQVATFEAPASYIDALGIYTNPARHHLIEKMKSYNPRLELLDIRHHIMQMRVIKQPPELAALQAAIDLTEKTLKKVTRKSLENFTTENALEAAITANFRKYRANHGYAPIVASGKNACTLHYVMNNGGLNNGELVLLDVGAEVENYSADITRTYSYGEPTKRQQDVFTAVLQVQDFAMSQLKPGVKVKEYEKQIEQFMGEKLRELKLIKSITHEAVRQYYPHATSHFLGLDVHDVGDYESPLEVDMVLTVEPGIYIPEEGIGIRIEDDVLVTHDGVKVLSKRLPKLLS